jgi:hypothetical protein
VAAPQIQRAVLLIADIGGYTRFMKLTRWNLAHAQQVVADLLEAVIDASGPLKLSKLEGDAALFWAPLTEKNANELTLAVADIRRAFLTKRAKLVGERMCDCESCEQIERLNLKFVAHQGEIALQKVKGHVELAGVDVIIVHRMLKNDVPVVEYVLMTDGVKAKLPQELSEQALELKHDFEGIGEVQTHYVDLSKVEMPVTVVAPRGLRKLWQKLKFELSALPYGLGLRKPLESLPRTLASITPEGPAQLAAGSAAAEKP